MSSRELRSLLAPRRRRIVALGLSSVTGGALEAFFLVVITRIAFAITDGDRQFGIIAGREATVGQALTLAFALVVVRVSLSALTAWQGASLGADVVATIRHRLAEGFLMANWGAQSAERGGRLQELMTTFVHGGASLISGVAAIVSSGFTLVALLAIAVIIDPLSALVVVVAVGVLGSVLRPLRASIQGQARRTAVSGMDFATSLDEVSRLGLEMHVFGVQDSARTRLDSLIRTDEATTRRLNLLRSLVPSLYTGLAYLALVGAVSIVAVLGPSTLSSVGAVMLLMLRSLSYGQSVQSAVAAILANLPFLGALEAQIETFTQARIVDHGDACPDRLTPLCLHDVSFSYEPGRAALSGVDLQIERGEVVGVVGPSGSGKSTLVQVLLGVREPSSGVVTANGLDIREVDRDDWTRRVAFVPQHSHLMRGTVADNIRFLRMGVTDAQIERAARRAEFHDVVTAWPQGYDRVLGEGDGQLSGGQLQRLSIARALAADPEILVLDEPTSSQDPGIESAIRDTLSSLRGTTTVVIIAHRLSTLDICDRIVVVQDGEVRAFDTPENLARDNVFFRDALAVSGLG